MTMSGAAVGGSGGFGRRFVGAALQQPADDVDEGLGILCTGHGPATVEHERGDCGDLGLGRCLQHLLHLLGAIVAVEERSYRVARPPSAPS